jgi:two-component system, NtrC family, response regulator AtoC
MTISTLLVDDDPSMLDTMSERLGRHGFHVECAASADAAIEVLGTNDVDVVVTDIKMRGMTGTELCGWIVANRPATPVILITGFGSLDTAVAAIRAGAYDFITKPFDIEQLILAMERAAQHRALREEVRRLREVVNATTFAGDLIGDSLAIQRLRVLIAGVSAVSTTVLITGESGAGKEVVARLIHQQSPRRAARFIAVNCAAVPETLLESELFGHVRGAFTDAKQARAGLLVQADKGTLLLDEIGDIPIGLQVKLLRALEERRVRPIGGDNDVTFDIRLVAATHRNLEGLVAAGTFREDLYYRLNVIQVAVPPLRARGNDVLLLAQCFLKTFSAQLGKHITMLSPSAAECLVAYNWPGNVRELKNSMERAVALTQSDQILVDDLPEKIRRYRGGQIANDTEAPAVTPDLVPMSEIERRHIARVLAAVHGSKAAAARILGYDRTTLYRKLSQYKLQDAQS